MSEDTIGFVWTGEERRPRRGDAYLYCGNLLVADADHPEHYAARRICRPLTAADAVVSAEALEEMGKSVAFFDTNGDLDLSAAIRDMRRVLASRLPAPQPSHLATLERFLEAGGAVLKHGDLVKACAWAVAELKGRGK